MSSGAIYGIEVTAPAHAAGCKAERVSVSAGVLGLMDRPDVREMMVLTGVLAFNLIHGPSAHPVAHGVTMAEDFGKRFVILDCGKASKLILTYWEWLLAMQHTGDVQFLVHLPPEDEFSTPKAEA